MNSKKILIVIAILSVTGVLVSFNAWGESKWSIVRDDDIARDDGVEGDLQDAHFPDAKNGWAVGSQGLILHTADGGKTWTKREIEMERSSDLWNIYFRDTNHGFITGTRGAIFMTKDGGKTWARKDAKNLSRMQDGQPAVLQRRRSSPG